MKHFFSFIVIFLAFPGMALADSDDILTGKIVAGPDANCPVQVSVQTSENKPNAVVGKIVCASFEFVGAQLQAGIAKALSAQNLTIWGHYHGTGTYFFITSLDQGDVLPSHGK